LELYYRNLTKSKLTASSRYNPSQWEQSLFWLISRIFETGYIIGVTFPVTFVTLRRTRRNSSCLHSYRSKLACRHHDRNFWARVQTSQTNLFRSKCKKKRVETGSRAKLGENGDARGASWKNNGRTGNRKVFRAPTSNDIKVRTSDTEGNWFSTVRRGETIRGNCGRWCKIDNGSLRVMRHGVSGTETSAASKSDRPIFLSFLGVKIFIFKPDRPFCP